MKTGTKAIYINGALVVGLALELYRGRSLLVIGITAILLFTVANVALIVRRKLDGPQ
jgi:hypothetical protein